MATERIVLILSLFWDDYSRGQIMRVAQMLDCKQRYEFSTFEEFQKRWGAYDWESPAFQRAVVRRYRKICVQGSVTKEYREMLERVRPFYENSLAAP